MIGVGGGGEVVGDADAGQLQIFDALLSKLLFGALLLVVRTEHFLISMDSHLRFDVFAFPASGHVYIVTQFSSGSRTFNRR